MLHESFQFANIISTCLCRCNIKRGHLFEIFTYVWYVSPFSNHVTSGWVPIFNLFLDLQTMFFWLWSKNILSKLATMCCLEGVEGTNPNSEIGRWPLVNISPEVEGGFSGLSWEKIYSWVSLSISSYSFRLTSSGSLCFFLFLVSWLLLYSFSFLIFVRSFFFFVFSLCLFDQ